MPAPFRRAAFFDVDETLVAVPTLFRFLEWWLRAEGRPAGEYAEIERRLRSMTAAGRPRTEVSRAYFAIYRGLAEAEVAQWGRRWFAAESAGGPLYRPEVRERFDRHRRRGDVTVLVSGSFPACLDPIADDVGADVVLCSRPEVRGGRYTGDVEPLLGDEKAVAAAGLARDRGLGLGDCHAYGDHASDLPLLASVGHPVVVGGDSTLLEHAARRGWPRLRAAAGSRT